MGKQFTPEFIRITQQGFYEGLSEIYEAFHDDNGEIVDDDNVDDVINATLELRNKCDDLLDQIGYEQ